MKPVVSTTCAMRAATVASVRAATVSGVEKSEYSVPRETYDLVGARLEVELGDAVRAGVLDAREPKRQRIARVVEEAGAACR